MKSKAAYPVKLAWAARWALSVAFALGCLTAMGSFAQQGGSGGRSAPLRMGLVRLNETDAGSPASRPLSEKKAGERRRIPEAAHLTTPANAPSRTPLNATESAALPAQPAAAPAMKKPNMAVEQPPRPEEGQSVAGPQSTAPGAGKEGALKSPEAAPASSHQQGQADAPATIAARERTPYERTSDAARARSGEAARELEADRLDAGFGLLRSVRAGYPTLARRLGKAGRVRLELAIDPEGRVYRVDVLEETGGWGFGSSAAAAYRNARFTRPTVQGRPVRVLWRKTVIFRP